MRVTRDLPGSGRGGREIREVVSMCVDYAWDMDSMDVVQITNPHNH